MKILVTGCAGFIGSYVCKKLLDRGDMVCGIDNLNDYYEVSLKTARLSQLVNRKNFTFIPLDISNRSEISAVFEKEKFDRVIHLAAQAGVRYSLQNPHAYADSNLVGFLNILEGCRQQKVAHLVYASSSSVYGGLTEMPFSENQNVDSPVSLYAATKKSNELMAHAYSHLFSIPTTGLRFFTVYGPMGRPDMAYFSFTKAILAGKAIKVFNHGDMKRDFTYIDDIVEGVIRVSDKIAKPKANSTVPYRIFNIGNRDPVPLLEFIHYIEEALGQTASKEFLPMQDGDVPATYANTEELAEWVDFQPSTHLKTGISEFVRWYRDYYHC